jgi:uncharacterized delta-60 repeat protein
MNRILLGLTHVVCTIVPNLMAATAVPGDLDLSFGTAGSLTSFTPGSVKIQTDGKLVVVGAAPGGGHPDFGLVRYLTDGSLDTTFGVGGKVTVDLSGSAYEDEAHAVVIQSDGKLVVAGYSDGKFAVARFTTNGAFDTTFGINGVVVLSNTIYPLSGVGATSLAIQTDGKIVFAGPRISLAGNQDFNVFLLTATGDMDTSFGSDGSATADFASGSDWPTSLALTSAGKIIVVGYTTPTGTGSHNDIGAVACFTSNGGLDTTFSTDGKTTLQLGLDVTLLSNVAVLASGKVMVAGQGTVDPLTTGSDFVLARYNTDGSLDATFGTNGIVTTDLSATSSAGYYTYDAAQSLAIQPDGNMILSGTSYDVISGGGGITHMALTRHLPDGTLDTSFGKNGMAIALIGSSKDTVSSSALQTDGKIVILGTSTTGGIVSPATVRFWGFTPHETWRLKYFGSTVNTGSAADASDFDLDGLLEYALGTSPKSGANGANNLAYSLAHVGGMTTQQLLSPNPMVRKT